MITEEDYVSFETAKLLKEKGFNIPTEFVWYEHLPSQNAALAKDINKQKLDYFYLDKNTDRNSPFNNGEIPSYIIGEVYSAPTLQTAMKWLREVHKIHIQIWILEENGYWFNIEKILNAQYKHKSFYSTGLEDIYFESWEEACEAAIKYCLENLI